MEYTYQDYEKAQDRYGFLLEAVKARRASPEFRRALEAVSYFRGENPEVARKTITRAAVSESRDESGMRRLRAVPREAAGNRVGSGFLHRFVCQQNQFLLQNGVQAEPAVKARLGKDFDHQLQRLGERALLQGVCWGFWNVDHLEIMDDAKDAFSGFVPFMDEMTGQLRAGAQFWQMSTQKPLYIRLFEEDGVTILRQDGYGGMAVVQKKRPYMLIHRKDALSETMQFANWPRLPVIPLYANDEHRSELTPAIKAKIDAYDRILSDFADNLDRANDVYWVLNNFGGTADDVAEMLAEISRIKAVANLSDGTGGGATAEPRTIEVPYQARQAALNILERALYADYMALDMAAITGGSLTNVAIRAACANLNLKSDRYEWEVFAFVRQVLLLMGIDTDAIRFQRQSIANETETVQAIYMMRQDIDRETALKLNPMLQTEEIERLLNA